MDNKIMDNKIMDKNIYCNAYGYKEFWNKLEPCPKNQVEINIKNGCMLCNNNYYQLNNKLLYNRIFFNDNIISPCNNICMIDISNYFRNSRKSY